VVGRAQRVLCSQDGQLVDAVDPATGATVGLAPPPGLAAALAELGLGRALGSLRLLQLDPPQARLPGAACL